MFFNVQTLGHQLYLCTSNKVQSVNPKYIFHILASKIVKLRTEIYEMKLPS